MLCNYRRLVCGNGRSHKRCLSSLIEKPTEFDEVAAISEEEIGPRPSHFRPVNDPVVIKHDRKHMAASVACLAEAREKIDYVNPYERPWSRVEYRNHRDWMTPLVKPRRAYKLEQNTLRYMALPYYQYATKTYCQDNLEEKMQQLNKSSRGTRFKQDYGELTEQIVESVCSDWKAIVDRVGEVSRPTITSMLIEQLTTKAIAIASNDYPHIRRATQNYDYDLESFWVRGGYDYLYEYPKLKKYQVGRKGHRVFADDPRKLGELAFVYKEKAVMQIRQQLPLQQMEWPYHCYKHDEIPVFPYNPQNGFAKEDAYVTQLTGYELDVGEPCEYNSVVVVDCSDVWKVVGDCAAEPSEQHLQSNLLCTAMSTAFAALCAQAHALGFTQHNDLMLHEGAVPLVTHVIVTDGNLWYFCSYQLNTIDLLNPYICENRKCNMAYSSGPHYLCNDLNDNLQPADIKKDVINMYLGFLLDKPWKPVDRNEEPVNMTPYLGNKGVKSWGKAFRRRDEGTVEEEEKEICLQLEEQEKALLLKDK